MSISNPNNPKLDIHNHPRLSEYDRLVYPVLSRRAGGLSLGINLNPTKNCSYNCVYCQVDRSVEIKNLKVDLEQITDELTYWIDIINDPEGEFSGVALKDIAIAGDGEPTLCKKLPALIQKLVELKQQRQIPECKLVLFTNGTRINDSDLMEKIPDFMQSGGEIWYKLDFWDESSFKMINRSQLSFSKIIENLIAIGSKYPVILQSCFFSLKDQSFSIQLYQPYINLIRDLIKKGVQIKLIQVYTVARKPTESYVKPWTDSEMDLIYQSLSSQLNLEISVVYGGLKKEQ